MFGSKDKNNKDVTLEKVPTSFSNSQSSVIPKKDNKAVRSNSTTLIARDTELFGDVKFSGNLEVEGLVVGNIMANPNSEASIRVLEQGQIEGDINVPKAVINGLVKGNVHAAQIELAENARIEGNVHYEALEMVKGAKVNGSLLFADKPASHVNPPSQDKSKALDKPEVDAKKL